MSEEVRDVILPPAGEHWRYRCTRPDGTTYEHFGQRSDIEAVECGYCGSHMGFMDAGGTCCLPNFFCGDCAKKAKG